MEFALFTASLKTPSDFGPISKACQPSYTPWVKSNTLVYIPPFIYLAAMQSRGKWTRPFLSRALFRTLFKSYLFAGNWTFVEPSLNPNISWTKGWTIPPPMIISSETSIMLLINSSLSMTFAPPRTARTGFLGFSKNPPK